MRNETTRCQPRSAGATAAPLLRDRAYIAVLRAAGTLQAGVAELLKEHGLTPNQYNVLRILRGADRLTCSEIGERMITRDPDITRLLDRLEAQGLIERSRSVSDRRAVLSHISEAGAALIAPIDAPMRELHARQTAALGDEALGTLIASLSRLAAK